LEEETMATRKQVFGVLATGALLGTMVVLLAAPAAHATHTVTSCNDDPGGSDELYVEWHSVVLVGADGGLGGAGGTGKAVCFALLGSSTNVLVDVLDPDSSSIGNTVRIRLCSPTISTCTTVLDETGVEVNVTAPLFSCVWVNGVQQNPGCP
jgi:hypothetical protein